MSLRLESLKVLKFGGTSVGSPEALQRAARIVATELPKGGLVVVSALSGPTDRIGQAVEAAIHRLRYHRQRVLTRLNIEFRATEALSWKPADGKWSVKENLIHLAVWDRFAAGVFAAIAEGRPVPGMPFPEGGLDEWNKAQVAAGAWMSLADVLVELGAAREAMEAQIRRLTPEQGAVSPAKDWLSYGEHDKEHMYRILERLTSWREATEQ